MSLTHERIMDGVYHISDGRGNFCTLLVGEKGAILYDTMMGLDDLRSYVSGLTGFEPVVVNSHCHFDHMGGNYQFEQVWMGEEDLSLMAEGLRQIPELAAHFQADLTRVKESFSHPDRVSVLKPGQVFDLGGKTVKAIHLPGHTPGSMGLLCEEDRLLLAGDGISPQMCLFFPESLSVEEYRKTVDSLKDLPFDGFLLGHFKQLFPRKCIDRFAQCFDLIGKKRGMDYAFPPLPYRKGLFYILTPRDPELGELIGIVVKKP